MTDQSENTRPATVKAFRDNTGYASPDGAWIAYDTENYDGAPDAGRAAHLLGRGHTEAEALADWDREAADVL